MDAPNPSSMPTLASRTPLRIGAVGLIARDAPALAAWYTGLLGLAVLERGAAGMRLGTPGGVSLLDIAHRPDAKPDDNRTAGLYHTAFLMPTRADHARWILHLSRARTPISGASDHGVSEAFYLDDPEGNGVEVYNDRPPETWLREGGRIAMPNKALDIEAIVAEADPASADYPEAPEGLRIGHIHLRVGNVAQAEAYYRDVIGLDITRARGGATFLSSGGYHHHVGVNVWHSDGAGLRDPDRAGLAWFEIEGDATALAAVRDRLEKGGMPVTGIDGGFETADPWGTRIRTHAAC